MATTTEIQEEIIDVYIAAFNRAPDADGLAYWVSKVQNDNWSVDDVAKSFFDSEEVASKYPPTLSDEEFLNTVYNNVLGRDGDPDGIAYWLEQMQNGITRDEMLITIINGAKADTGNPEDKLYLQNKLDVAYHFAVTLGLNDLELSKNCMESITTQTSSVDESMDRLDAYKYSLDSNISLIEGDDTDNTLNGTDTTNYIYAFDGDDVITSGDGDNLVVAGRGVDTIYTGSGNDIIKCRLGDDTVYAADGDDTIYGDEDNDSLHAEAGADKVYGGSGNDYIYGDDGDDILYGGVGSDIIQGGLGNDKIYGEDDDDIIDAGDGENFVDGGDGDDTIYGGNSKDNIYGGAGNDTIYALEGDDTVDGLTGDDTIYAGVGNDTINGNEGDDILYGSSGDDTLFGELGSDRLYGGEGKDTLTGGEGSDTFVFLVGDSTLVSMDTILDFAYSQTLADKISLVNHGSEVIYHSKLDVSTANSLSEAANLASAGDGSANALVRWFVYEDNTYIVEDMSSDGTFQNSSDIIIELQGIVDLLGLDTSTISFI